MSEDATRRGRRVALLRARLSAAPGARWLGRHASRLIALAAVALLAAGLVVAWPHLREYPWSITGWPVALAALAYPPALLLAAGLWGAVLHHLGGHASWTQNLKLYCATCLARRLPTPLWFIAGRLSMYHRIGVAQSMTSMAMVLEQALILFSGALLSVATMLLPGSPIGLPARYAPWLGGLLLVCLVLVLRPNVLPRIVSGIARRLGHDASWNCAIDHRHMIVWTGGYLVIWTLGGVTLFCLLRALYPLPAARLPAAIGAWAVAGTVSSVALFLPAGLGIREASLVAMLSTFAPLPVAVVVAVVTRLWYALLELLFYGLTLRLR